MSTMALPPELRYVDIGINLTDPIFRGIYHGKQAHEDDFSHMLDRARAHGVRKLIVTGSDLNESEQALQIARDHPTLCRATTGIHPCSAKTFLPNPTETLRSLRTLILNASTSTSHDSTPTIAALGEIGLDYDRLFLTDKPTQLKYFTLQLDLAVSLHTGAPIPGYEDIGSGETLSKPLPLFLHSRAAHADFVNLLKERLPHLPARGVVHSFTGSVEEMRELVGLGLDIGVNGCSLKTAENLAVVKEIPLDRLQLETDGPWCEIRPSSAGMGLLAEVRADGEGRGYRTREEVLGSLPRGVKKEKWDRECVVKGRTEPCMVGLVGEIVARVKGVRVEEVAEMAWGNSCRMFGLDEGEGQEELEGGVVDGMS